MNRRRFLRGAMAGCAVGAAGAVLAKPLRRQEPNLPPRPAARGLVGIFEQATSLNRHEAERAALTINQLMEV